MLHYSREQILTLGADVVLHGIGAAEICGCSCRVSLVCVLVSSLKARQRHSGSMEAVVRSLPGRLCRSTHFIILVCFFSQ